MQKDKLKEGDIIFSDCVGHEILCEHLGIVYKKGNNVYVFHNAPTNLNKFGGTIVSEPYEKYKNFRDIKRVVRTNVSNHRILEVSKNHKFEVWDSIYFNCEDFVNQIVYGERESNIRDAYKIAALGLGVLLII
jgi:hypothetical protein